MRSGFRLLDMLFPPRKDEAAVRALSADGLCTLIEKNEAYATTPRTNTLLPFSDPRVRATIHEAKYYGNKRAIVLLGAVFARALAGYGCPVCVIPLPLGKKRRRLRGFNQSERIARIAFKRLETSRHRLSPELLVRIRETEPQTTLTKKDRAINMHGAFGAVHVLDPSLTYLVFDDVLTTGATLQAAIDALREAGAEKIIPLALAH